MGFIMKRINFKLTRTAKLLIVIFVVYAAYSYVDIWSLSTADISENSVNEIKHHARSIYKPDWKDLDQRPLPEWYDRAKIGILVHLGIYSVPSFSSSSSSAEWYWSYWKTGKKEFLDFISKNYPADFTYQHFAAMFKAEFFNANKWADLFRKAGAKYVVLTSKHHDGFNLFPSKQSFHWNSVEIGPRRDFVGELAKAVNKNNLTFGVYYYLCEFNPLYLYDKARQFTTFNYREDKLWPDIKQLINDYKPSIIWADEGWECTDSHLNTPDLLAWLYNKSPVKDTVVVNDRWSKDTSCNHGDFYSNCSGKYEPGK